MNEYEKYIVSGGRVGEIRPKTLFESARAHVLVAASWLAAVVLGILFGSLPVPWLRELLDCVAKIFTRLFQFIAIPIIAVAVITTLSSLGARRETVRIFGHAVFYTLSTTVAAALVALGLFLVIGPGNIPLSPEDAAKAGEAVQSNVAHLSYFDHFLSVVPNNILQPFLGGNVLSVLMIAAAVGLALAFMPRTENREALLKVILGAQDLLFTLIRAILFILPLGIMAFTSQLVTEIQAGVIVGALGQYVAVVLGGNVLQFFVIIPLFLLARKLNPLKIFRGMFPALAVAFFSKSSAGTLPVTLASAEDKLQLDTRVTRFVLPICTTINMNGCAAFILVTSLFLMQNAGINITAGTMAVWLVVAVFAAIGNAGVPMGCYFLTLSLMTSIGVPVELMGIILPIYAVIDMVETCVNVWSDSAVAAMTDHDLHGKLQWKSEVEAA